MPVRGEPTVIPSSSARDPTISTRETSLIPTDGSRRSEIAGMNVAAFAGPGRS
jgi:hypothetical protein